MNGLPEAPQIHDIHLPGDPSWWPPAIGWWVLLVAWGFMLFLFGRYGWQWYLSLRFRNYVLGLLDDIADPKDDSDHARFLSDVSQLLKRVAIHVFPKTNVATLSGADWTRFLSQTGGDFSDGDAALIGEGGYRKTIKCASSVVRNAARQWISKNLGRRP